MTRIGSRREQTPAESGPTVVGMETHGARPVAADITVADIRPAGQPLPEVPAERAIQGLLASLRPAQDSSDRPVEARSRLTSGLVAGVRHHPLIAALHLAHIGHRPIALSPDMIWLLICQAVGHHIDSHAETLRSSFVAHPGRLTLAVNVRSKEQEGSATSAPEFFDEILREIRQQVGSSVDRFMPSFTTTGAVERAAAGLVLLSAMRSYSHPLVTDSDCGITSVTLEGTAEDWGQILDHLAGFSGLGLDPWLEALRPILHQFNSAACGDIDRGFWGEMYLRAESEGSTSESSAGWIHRFFPSLIGDDHFPSRRILWPEAGRRPGSQGLLDEGTLPSGLTSVPLTWDRRDGAGRLIRRRDMELIGGFVGVSQDPETLCLRPEIGWVIRERKG